MEMVDNISNISSRLCDKNSLDILQSNKQDIIKVITEYLKTDIILTNLEITPIQHLYVGIHSFNCRTVEGECIGSVFINDKNNLEMRIFSIKELEDKDANTTNALEEEEVQQLEYALNNNFEKHINLSRAFVNITQGELVQFKVVYEQKPFDLLLLCDQIELTIDIQIPTLIGLETSFDELRGVRTQASSSVEVPAIDSFQIENYAFENDSEVNFDMLNPYDGNSQEDFEKFVDSIKVKY